MKRVDWKERFAAEHQLVHLDPTILDLLLDRPDPVTPDAVGALAKDLLSSVVIDLVLDTDHKASNGWRARIKAFMPEVAGGDDDDNDVDEAAFLIDEEDPEPLLPPDIRAELQADIARAADELRPLRDAIKRERSVPKAHPTKTVVRTTIQPRKADWAKWLAMPSWTTAETAALLLDLDPGDVKLPGKTLPGKVRSAFAEKLDHVARHVGAGNLKDPMKPDAVKTWASTHKQDVPAALEDTQSNSLKAQNSDPDHIHHLTKTLYQKAFLYLAVKHYGYDFEAGAKNAKGKISINGGVGMNSIAAEMEEDLDQAGVKISAKKLAEYLDKSAADLIGSGGKGVYVDRLRAAKKQR